MSGGGELIGRTERVAMLTAPELYGQSPEVRSVEGAQSLRILRHSDNSLSKRELRSSADE